MKPAPPSSDPWRRLYAAALAQAQVFERRELDSLPGLDDELLEQSQAVLVAAVLELARDRGEITFERWATAALETFETRLAVRGRGGVQQLTRQHIEQHVRDLRALLAQRKAQRNGGLVPAAAAPVPTEKEKP